MSQRIAAGHADSPRTVVKPENECWRRHGYVPTMRQIALWPKLILEFETRDSGFEIRRAGDLELIRSNPESRVSSLAPLRMPRINS